MELEVNSSQEHFLSVWGSQRQSNQSMRDNISCLYQELSKVSGLAIGSQGCSNQWNIVDTRAYSIAGQEKQSQSWTFIWIKAT